MKFSLKKSSCKIDGLCAKNHLTVYTHIRKLIVFVLFILRHIFACYGDQLLVSRKPAAENVDQVNDVLTRQRVSNIDM